MKHLRLFESLEDFNTEYQDEGFPVSFTCSAGTFTYDREDTSDDCYVWKNGDKELITNQRIPAVGEYSPIAGTGAYDPDPNGDGWWGSDYTEIEITAISEEKTPAKYITPWTSLTKYPVHDKMTANVSGSISGITYDDKVTFIKTDETYTWWG